MGETNPRVEGLEIVADEIVGAGGFLTVRRVTLRNRRSDGTMSAAYVCDYVIRPYGMDAVVVCVFCRRDGTVSVLLRDGLRPALALGRDADSAPVPDRRPYLFLTELVAGIVEVADRGEAGIRARAAAEVAEEAGFTVAAADIVLLGAATFPTPGTMAEKFWLTAVEVADPGAATALEGDGSPMEEGATTRWLPLADAIAACVAGDIEDAKTELGLRRLEAWLAGQDSA